MTTYWLLLSHSSKSTYRYQKIHSKKITNKSRYFTINGVLIYNDNGRAIFGDCQQTFLGHFVLSREIDWEFYFLSALQILWMLIHMLCTVKFYLIMMWSLNYLFNSDTLEVQTHYWNIDSFAFPSISLESW